MPTVFTHPAIPLAVRAVTGGNVTSRRLILFAAFCSVLPDVDSIGLVLGVPYGSFLGHRGFTHSLAFALLLALGALPFAGWLAARRSWVFGCVFLCTASHGLLDALTDDGLGVAFFSPFSHQRFFLPWQPIPASPLGIVRFLSPAGLDVLTAELLFIWLPCLLVALAARAARRFPKRSAKAWTILALAVTIAGASGVAVGLNGSLRLPVPWPSAKAPGDNRAMLTAAIENLEAQAAKLAAQPGSACPQDFSTLDTGRPLRVSLFYGYDDHDGRVHDRANALAMAHVLTGACRGGLSTCGFSLVSRSRSTVSLRRSIGGRDVEVNLFTSSLEDDIIEPMSFLSAHREQAALSRSVRGHFHRELVASDIVFFMGHSRLGGDVGFDRQTGVTTLVNAVSRRPLRPVLDALRQRPSRLKILGMFSCTSKKFFRQDFLGANPSLFLILTTGDIRYGPAEQASLGALESVLSRKCGRAFHQSMVSVTEPDPTMTYLFRGR